MFHPFSDISRTRNIPECHLEWLPSNGITHDASHYYIQAHTIIQVPVTINNTCYSIPLASWVQTWTSNPFLEMSGTWNLWKTSWNICAESFLASGMQYHLWNTQGLFPSWLWALYALESFPDPQIGLLTCSRSYLIGY